jgi:carbon storage regulator
MLILARRIGESIMIGDQIEISVVDIKGDQAKLGISAPPQVKVYRREVYTAIQEENRAAAAASPASLPHIEGLLEKKAPPGGTPPAGGSQSGGSRPGGSPPAGSPPGAPGAPPSRKT